MEEIILQINGGIMINDNVSVKTVMNVKKIMLGILLHVVVKMENVAFLLMIIAFLIAVINYFCFLKYRAKQKHLLPFNEANDEIREVLY